MNISLESTRNTPMLSFKGGHIQIEGRSIPATDPGFFNSLIHFTKRYSVNPAPVTVVDIHLEFINAYSKKSLIQFFLILESIHKKGHKLTINWHYYPEDESILELGSIYQSMVKVPFNFKIT
jgi:hypothetical protein